MNTQFTTFVSSNPSFSTANGRGRGTGAKRGRKPRGAGPQTASESPRPPSQTPAPSTSQLTPIQWMPPQAPDSTPSDNKLALPRSSTPQPQEQRTSTDGLLTMSRAGSPVTKAVDANFSVVRPGVQVTEKEEDGEGEDEVLPAMADDDYSAQLSWQSQSKDNLKVLMDNFTPEQYDRFEAYRRHALPKQAIRKVVQQTLGQQVSQPVAQVIAGFSKVFVGEIVEKARKVQERRGDVGPLSPDHLREAYRMYQEETGRVGAARPLRAKRMFVR